MWESPSNLIREREIANAFAAFKKLKAYKFNKSAYEPYDYILIDPASKNTNSVLVCGANDGPAIKTVWYDNQGLLECKVRNCKSTQWPEYYLTFDKWVELVSILNATNLPVYLAVQFIDGIFWAELKPEMKNYRQGTGGRSDRGASEIQPVIFFPMSIFQKIEK